MSLIVIRKEFGVITSDGDYVPLFFFSQGLRFYMETYIKNLEEVGLSLVKRLADGRDYV